MTEQDIIDAFLEEAALDKHCSDILAVLWKKKEMRFNDLYRALKKRGVTLSKPTLSEHLKHLRKKKWVTRKARGAQNVTYRIHDTIQRTSREEGWKWIEDTLKQWGVDFTESPPETRAGFALYTVLSRKMEELLLRIEIEPRINNHTLNFSNTPGKSFENNLVRNCKKDEKYRKAVLNEMKMLQEIFNQGAEMCIAQTDNLLKK